MSVLPIYTQFFGVQRPLVKKYTSCDAVFLAENAEEGSITYTLPLVMGYGNIITKITLGAALEVPDPDGQILTANPTFIGGVTNVVVSNVDVAVATRPIWFVYSSLSESLAIPGFNLGYPLLDDVVITMTTQDAVDEVPTNAIVPVLIEYYGEDVPGLN